MVEPLNKAPSEGEREGTKREEDTTPREKSKTQSGSLGGQRNKSCSRVPTISRST